MRVLRSGESRLGRLVSPFLTESDLMPMYFFDLDSDRTNYIDDIGTDLTDDTMVMEEIVAMLATSFRDHPPNVAGCALMARVRNAEGEVIFTAELTLKSEWTKTQPSGPALKPPRRAASS
jgi:hypothetical protein